MGFSDIYELFNHPRENSIDVFVLGIVFVLSLYHLFLYFQHKDKVYLYYATYTGLLFIGHISKTENNFIADLAQPFDYYFHLLDGPLLLFYNTFYFIFALSFVNLKEYSPVWHKGLFRVLNMLLSVILISSLYFFYSEDVYFMHAVIQGTVLFIFIFGLVCYYPAFITEIPLKNYIIFGSLVLYVTSFFGFYLHALFDLPKGTNINYSIFLVGVVIENLIFSIGLGQKQKYILQEKNETQLKLISELEKNKILQDGIQRKLEEDMVSISKEAAESKVEQLTLTYENQLLELKMSSLRSQMNPHFIFNSLNSIKHYIIENEPHNAVYYLNKFSKLIRKILDTTRKKEITLYEELETLKLYIDIENIRFSNDIQSNIEVDENISSNTIYIPSLILQPFVENAIWHGLSSLKRERLLYVIVTQLSDSHITIVIEDNGIGRARATEIKSKKIHRRESVGISLTKERLESFSKNLKNDYTLEFIDLIDIEKNPIGTKVIIKMPLY